MEHMTNEQIEDQIERLSHYMEEENYRTMPNNRLWQLVSTFYQYIRNTEHDGMVVNLSAAFDEVADDEPKIEDIVTFCIPSVDSDKGPEHTCPICLEDDFEKNMIITNCKHVICVECMKQHLQSIHDSGNIPCCSVCRTSFMFLEAFDFDKCYELEAILRQ